MDKVRQLALAAVQEWFYGDVDAELDYVMQELKRALAEPAPSVSNWPRLYEDLRAIIDGGSESMTHADAVEMVRQWAGMPPIEFDVYVCGDSMCDCSPDDPHKVQRDKTGRDSLVPLIVQNNLELEELRIKNTKLKETVQELTFKLNLYERMRFNA